MRILQSRNYILRGVSLLEKTITKITKFEFIIKIKTNRVIALFFLYTYGLFGFNRVLPIWENLDGKIYFITTQTIIIFAIVYVFYVQLKFFVKQEEIIKEVKITAKNLSGFLTIFLIMISLNFRTINIDLYGDETSYAKYTYWHFEKILKTFISTNSNYENIDLNKLIQIVAILSLMAIGFFTFGMMRTSINSFYLLVIALTVILRLLNLRYFQFSNENTHPFLLVYQSFLAIFGVISSSFRLASIFIFTTFAFLLWKEIHKIIKNKFLTSLALSGYLSTPLILSASSKIDHGIFTFFTVSFIFIWWIDKWKIPLHKRKVFILSSIYFSLTNFVLLFMLVIIILVSQKIRAGDVLQKLKSQKNSVYVYIVPFLAVHISKFVKQIYYSYITGTPKELTLVERLEISVEGLFQFTNRYSIFLIAAGMIFLLSKFTVSKFFFLLGSFLVYAIFTAPGSVGWNRYYLGWLMPVIAVFYVGLFNIKFSWRRQMASFLVGLLIILNVFSFRNFINEYSRFDSFLAKNQWNIAKDNLQPENVIWPFTDYRKSLGKTKSVNNKVDCLIVGNFWSAVPETLSGYSTKSVFELQGKYELNRKTLDELMFYDGKTKYLDLKNLECLTLIAPVNKNLLREYLLKGGWIPRNSNSFGSDYNLYTLQKPRPID
jgi:hypothetical protein